MSFQPIFCCKDMLALIMHSDILRVGVLGGTIDISIRGNDPWSIPLKYCPSCGKEFRLTFLTDSEVDE